MKFEKTVEKLLSRKRNIALAGIAVLLVACLALYSSDWFMFDFVDSVNKATINRAAVGNVRHMLLKWGDEVNILGAIQPGQNPNIADYELQLSPNDLDYFKQASSDRLEAGYSTEETADYKRITLKHEGKEYDVGMALYGDRPEHWIGTKKSFKIKTAKDEYINNKKRLNFILPDGRGFFLNIFVEQLAEKLGLFSLEYEVASVSINGIPQGLYLVEEALDERYTERNGRPELLILEYSENWLDDHPIRKATSLSWNLTGLVPPGGYDYSAGVTYATGHNTPFDLEISNFREIDSEQEREVNYRLYQLLEAVEENNQGILQELLDIENVSSVEAMRAVLGNTHDFTGDNLRLFYDTTSGKFGFVPRNEGNMGRLKVYNGGIDNYLSTYADNPVPILRYVLRNDEVRNKRNEKIYSLLQDSEWLVEEFNRLNGMYGSAFTGDRTLRLSSRETARRLDWQLNTLRGNIVTLQKQFDYSKAYINVVKEGSKVTVEVIPDSGTAIKFNSFSLGLDSGERMEAVVRVFDEEGKLVAEETAIAAGILQLQEVLNKNIIQASLGEEMEPVRTVFSYEVLFPEGTEFELVEVKAEMENAITGKLLEQGDVYIKLAAGDSEYSELQNMGEGEFVEMYSELAFEKQGSELHLVEGDYQVERDIVIPKGLLLVVEAGTKIKIAPGKSIVSYSNLDIRGEEEKVVEIMQLVEGQAFGVVGIIGQEGESKTTIRHLEISGGSEKFINGIFFSGQLSIYHSDAEIIDSKISGSSSDDGLNIKFGEVLIEGSEFVGNLVDQVDLDFCTGTVKNSSFGTSEEHVSGDGLDLSGSKMLVKGSSFEGMDDKGISIGEETWVVLYNNAIEDNNMGSAVKDNSDAFFIKNSFTSNRIAISSYEKKPLFGGARFYIYGNEFLGNETKLELDQKSEHAEISFTAEELLSLSEALRNDEIPALERLLGSKG